MAFARVAIYAALMLLGAHAAGGANGLPRDEAAMAWAGQRTRALARTGVPVSVRKWADSGTIISAISTLMYTEAANIARTVDFVE
eukprot:9467520-Pyramimonas_sp.AAC.1